jgi:glycosyltransferase involved in cell wall biosynthesis
MRQFADQIACGLRDRGHRVDEITAPVIMSRLLPRTHPAAKWLGYVDQFLIFPPRLYLKVRQLPVGSLCVLSDQALAPWLGWFARRPHVVHCHDLLALEAAVGLQPFHRPSTSGCCYQYWIRRGFRRGRCFLSVSAATKKALENHLLHRPHLSAVLYNYLHPRFSVIPPSQSATLIQRTLPGIDEQTFVLHIGRNWYKNRLGVLEIFGQLHFLQPSVHLILVGSPDEVMQAWLQKHSDLKPLVHVLDRASDDLIVALYNRAAVLLFPSHGEGFGWPILEALACGCPVITTDRPPMTEVGGDAVVFIPPAPSPPQALAAWARAAAEQVDLVLRRSPAEHELIRQLGFAQAHRFQHETWLDQLESFYLQALVFQGTKPYMA